MTVKILVAKAKRVCHGSNQIVVLNCPYCNSIHYHGDTSYDGSGSINGVRVADCGKGQYELVEIDK